MGTETIKQILERYKIKADLFLKNKLKAFIKDIQNNYAFCDILEVRENSIIIKHFKGKRKDIQEEIYYVDIIKFVEYKDLEEINNN